MRSQFQAEVEAMPAAWQLRFMSLAQRGESGAANTFENLEWIGMLLELPCLAEVREAAVALPLDDLLPMLVASMEVALAQPAAGAEPCDPFRDYLEDLLSKAGGAHDGE